ncbi:MAG: Shikimate dehydrogenase (NADP(+)) [Myxococcota bacterium]|nr:Shikimate dehydrogenase (NADP(+)) [Myxococcota bacterium]
MGNPVRLAVIGHPVAHSRSPAMHNAACAALGAPFRMEAIEVEPSGLPEFIRRARVEFAGVSITSPHKEAVIPLLDAVNPEARSIGAVNCLFHMGGLLTGANTDASGFIQACEREGGVRLDGARALVIGAGGAARAVVHGLARRGAARVWIANRSPDRARELVAAAGGNHAALWNEAEDAIEPLDLLVNATTASRQGINPAPPGLFRHVSPRALAMDLTYGRPSPFLGACAAGGLGVMDGLPMLLYQAAEAFSFWTGRAAPLEVMRRALEE